MITDQKCGYTLCPDEAMRKKWTAAFPIENLNYTSSSRVALMIDNNDWTPVRALLEGTIPKDSLEYRQLLQIRVNDNIIKEACTRGFTELVSVFLKSEFPVNYIVNENNETILHFAASNDHLSLVNLLLNFGANIDRLSNYSESPLHMAVKQGHLAVAEYLISAGADINTKNKYGGTLLQAAFWSNHVTRKMVQLLLDSRCDPNIQGGSSPPLYMAVFHNDVKVVQMFLDAGAHVNGTATHIPLHWAAFQGYIPIMQLLLEYGADVNVTDENHNTTLHKAVTNRKLESVKFLIEHGSLINSVNNYHYHETPLSLSIKKKYFNIAMLIINSGADLNLHVHDTVLNKAVYKGAHIQLIESLLEHGASVSTVNNNTTALQYTIFHSKYSNDTKLQIAKLLLIYGSNHYVEDRCGNTLLHWACRMGHVELVEYLINYGLDVDAKNTQGKKLYDIATEKGHTNIMKTIIKYHCNKYTKF